MILAKANEPLSDVDIARRSDRSWNTTKEKRSKYVNRVLNEKTHKCLRK